MGDHAGDEFMRRASTTEWMYNLTPQVAINQPTHDSTNRLIRYVLKRDEKMVEKGADESTKR